MSVKAMTLPANRRTYGVPVVNIKMMKREYLDVRVGTSAEDNLKRSRKRLGIVEVTK